MARTRATLHTSIWNPDSDFRFRTADAQRTYFLILTQGDLSLCGVAALTVDRWSRLASDTKPSSIRKSLSELVEHRYLVVDEETEEVWIRTFTTHDGVLRQPNMVVSMSKDFDAIQSEAIREGFVEGLPDGLLEGLPNGYRARLAAPFLAWVLRTRTRAPSPSPTPSIEGSPLPEPKPTKGCQIPTDFTITDSMKTWATDNHIHSDISRETEKFLDHFSAKGESKKDWVAAWRNWMRRADEWAPKQSTTSQQSQIARGADPLPPEEDYGEPVVLPANG